ncbi:MAG TPA: permease [Pseudolysinimonas sp.]|nr:permease [Pseudolysinimonas sp.]
MTQRSGVLNRPSVVHAGASRRRGLWIPAAGLVLLCALGLVRIFSPVQGGLLPDRVQDGVTLALSVLIESMPFVVLGIVFSIVVRIWLPEAAIMRVLPRNPLARRAVVSMIGMFLPVCECGNVPLARGLMVRGLTVAESMTFLFAAPIINPITIITTHQAFGFDDGILVGRLVGGFVIANLLGWVFSRHPNPESLLTPRFAAECRLPEHDEHGSRLERSIRLFGRETAMLLPALFVGAIAAALVQTLVPRSVLVALGSNPVWSIAAMLVLAFVISVCSNVDAFFILPFASTFLPGSVVVFLLFGAMLDIKMIALLRTTFTSRTLLQVATIIVLASAAVGVIVNVLA